MKTGALIGLGFGFLWWLIGAGAVNGVFGTVLQIFGVFIFAAAGILIAKRRYHSAGGKPQWSYYIIAVIAEVVAITLSQAWLNAYGLKSFLVPVVGIIVGLHFIGLWRAFAHRRFLLLAIAMCAVNLLALTLPLTPNTQFMLSGFGSSASLLVTALLP